CSAGKSKNVSSTSASFSRVVTVAHGDHGRAHAPALQVPEHGLPALGALPVAPPARDQLLGPVGPHADHHERAEAIVLQPDVEMHAIDPHVDVVGSASLRCWKARYSASHSLVSRAMLVADNPAASSPSNTASASRTSPVDNPAPLG